MAVIARFQRKERIKALPVSVIRRELRRRIALLLGVLRAHMERVGEASSLEAMLVEARGVLRVGIPPLIQWLAWQSFLAGREGGRRYLRGQRVRTIFQEESEEERTERIRRYLNEGANKDGRIVEKAISEKVDERARREIVQKSVVEGLPTERVIRELRDVYAERTRSALEAWVRTVSMSAYNMGSMDTFLEAGVEYVRYDATFDDRVCPICAPLNGTIYKIPLTMWVQPPLHWNCRCRLTPIVLPTDEELARVLSTPDEVRQHADRWLVQNDYRIVGKRTERHITKWEGVQEGFGKPFTPQDLEALIRGVEDFTLLPARQAEAKGLKVRVVEGVITPPPGGGLGGVPSAPPSPPPAPPAESAEDLLPRLGMYDVEQTEVPKKSRALAYGRRGAELEEYARAISVDGSMEHQLSVYEMQMRREKWLDEITRGLGRVEAEAIKAEIDAFTYTWSAHVDYTRALNKKWAGEVEWRRAIAEHARSGKPYTLHYYGYKMMSSFLENYELELIGRGLGQRAIPGWINEMRKELASISDIMELLDRKPQLVSEADRVRALRIVERWMTEWSAKVMERLVQPFDAEGYMWYRGVGWNMMEKWVRLIEDGVIKEGSVFRSTAFWASSLSPRVADEYATGGGAVFHIISPSGRVKAFPVFTASVHPSEIELVITPEARMRVLRFEWRKAKLPTGEEYKVLHVWLEVLD